MCNLNEKIGIFSFFSGGGFLDLGFEASGYTILFASEISRAFMDAYQYSRQALSLPKPWYGYHVEEDGDVKELIKNQGLAKLKNFIKDSRQKFEVIGFIGGSPCPDFSVGGKNKGRNGDKGKLSSAYFDLVCHHKPDFFLFENVKGLWATKKHRSFYEELKIKVAGSGYVLVEQLVNSFDYGTPQDRERIILIGFLENSINSMINGRINDLKNEFAWNKFKKYSRQDLHSIVWPTSNIFREDSYLECPTNILEDLTVEYWFRKNEVYNHSNAHHYFKPRQGIQKFLSIDEGDNSRKSFKRLHRWRYSPTACYGNNEVHLHPYKARRLSVAEALAIQSLPHNFILPDALSLTHMFKLVGNGVPYLLAKGIADTLADFLFGYQQNIYDPKGDKSIVSDSLLSLLSLD